MTLPCCASQRAGREGESRAGRDGQAEGMVTMHQSPCTHLPCTQPSTTPPCTTPHKANACSIEQLPTSAASPQVTAVARSATFPQVKRFF